MLGAIGSMGACQVVLYLAWLASLWNGGRSEMVAQCPPEYVHRGGTSDCFLFHSGSRRTWNDASTYCVRENGNLVSIDSAQMTNWLNLQIAATGLEGDSSEFWIDAVYNSNNSKWYWASTGTEVNLEYIHEDSMPRAGDYGVITPDSTLRGYGESSEYHFICRRSINEPVFCNYEEGWHMSDNRCYAVSDYKDSWLNAQLSCQGMNGDLVTVNSQQEQFYVLDEAVRYHDNIWIGMTEINHAGNFYWVGDNSSDYTYWNQSSPVSMNGGASAVVDVEDPTGHWMTELATNQHTFLCERPTGSCVMGWEQFGEFCYYFNRQEIDIVTWNTAYELCDSIGTHLLVVDTQEEDDYIRGKIAEQEQLWIGLYYNVTGEHFEWVDGQPYSRNLTHMSPDVEDAVASEGAVKCVAAQIDTSSKDNCETWIPLTCEDTHGYVCEVPAGTPVYIPSPPTDQYCPEGWKLDQDFCYFLSDYEDTWTGGESYCTAHGGHLTSVNTWTEQDFIHSYLQGDSWIGLNDREENSHYVWADGNSLVIHNWAAGEPTGGGENCVEMKVQEGYWNDVTCSGLRNFVCKRDYSTTPLDPVTTTSTPYPNDGNCGYGWEEDLTSGICYMVVDQLLGFSDARLRCQELGENSGQSPADLVSLSSMDEQLFVGRMVASAQLQDAGLFIGLKNDETSLYWIDDEPVAFMNYADGEPNGVYSTMCTEMYNDGTYKWNDYDCTGRLPFICEQKGLGYTAPTAPTPSTKCPEDWTYFNGFCYMLFRDVMSWDDANAACASSYGSSLISILSEDENDFLFDFMNGYYDPWIGLHADANGAYNTWTDGSPVVYQNWETGEPNNDTGNEACVQFHSYMIGQPKTWNDVPCFMSQQFVCKTRYKTCPEGWAQHEQKCYFVGSETRTWESGRDACKQVDGEATLLSWHSQEEADYVQGLISDTFGLTWLGLYREEGDAWKWDDGTADDFINWRPGQPDHNDTEFCGLTVSNPEDTGFGLLENYPCNSSHYYACEFFPTHVVGCDEGWHFYGGFCYYKGDEMGTYSEVLEKCETRDADLVSILSKEENDFLVSLATGSWYHMGLRASGGGAQMSWSDGSPVLYTAFSSLTAPINDETCFLLTTYSERWLTYRCSDLDYYFCKKAATIISIEPSDSGCLSSTHLYHGTSCYAKMTTTTDYLSAAAKCSESFSSSHLVSIQNQVEEAFLSSYISSVGEKVWIGLQETVSSDGTIGFKWIDGTDFTYDSWGEYQPQTNIGECAYMSGSESSLGLWYITDCANNYNFMCEYERTGYTTAAPPVTTAGPAVCTDGWSLYSSTQSCYKVMSGVKSQGLAEKSCVQYGGHLVSIHSEQEETFIKKLPDLSALNASSLWTGLSIVGEEENYAWLDGTVTDYLHWANGQPNSHQLRDTCVCAQLGTFEWHDSYCDGYLPFICKAPQGAPVISTAQPITSAPDIPCDDFPDDPSWLKDGDNCYRIVSETEIPSQPWQDARKVCEHYGANLVSILSSAENSFLLSKVYKYSDDSLWIGGYADNEGGFRWSDGQPFDYYHWDDGEPNSVLAQESCLALFPQKFGYWNDDNCGTTKGFVCKKPLGGTAAPFTTAPPPAGHCAGGYLHAAGRCLQLVTEKLSFNEAQQRCRNSGVNGNLVSIHGPEMQAAVTVIMNLETEPSWIGLRVAGGTFKWVDQTVFTYDNWGAGQPNGDSEGDPCVQVQKISGYWEDVDCNLNRSFICAQNPQEELSTDAPAPRCASPLDQYLNYSGSCYRAVTEVRSWQGAEELCKAEGTNLVSVEGIAENALIYGIALAAGVHDVWLGLNSMKDPKQYTWSDTFPVLYTNWGSAQPNVSDTDSRCVALSASQGGTWYNTHCSRQMHFFCKYTREPIPTADPPVDGNCPSVRWQDFGGGYCYLIVLDSILTWNDANLVCVQEGGLLTSIHSQNELDQIEKATEHYSLNLWIGLFQGADAYKWSDGSGLDFTNWADGEPNSNDEFCVEMYSYTNRVWNDISCEIERAFVCKAPKIGGTSGQLSTFPGLVTTSGPGTGSNSNGLTGGAIAGIVIGCLLIVAALGLIGYYYRDKMEDIVESMRGSSSSNTRHTTSSTVTGQHDDDDGKVLP